MVGYICFLCSTTSAVPVTHFCFVKSGIFESKQRKFTWGLSIHMGGEKLHNLSGSSTHSWHYHLGIS